MYWKYIVRKANKINFQTLFQELYSVTLTKHASSLKDKENALLLAPIGDLAVSLS